MHEAEPERVRALDREQNHRQAEASSMRIHVCAFRSLVWEVPPEIHLHRDKLSAAHGVHLAVTKTLTGRCLCLIHDDGMVSFLKRVDIDEAVRYRAVW